MAGVLEQIFGPQKQLVRCQCVGQADTRALELQEAKTILAEIFCITISEVEEMIQNRFDAACIEDIGSKEDGLWPREFWLEM
jgi:hypothetical protein